MAQLNNALWLCPCRTNLSTFVHPVRRTRAFGFP